MSRCTLFLALGLIAQIACERPISLEEIERLQREGVNPNPGTTHYVEVGSAWLGFRHPQAIIVGNEPLIYVADTDNNRVVALDLGGRVIGISQPIQRPIALTQDKRLNLLVVAHFDTVEQSGTPLTYSAVYRIPLVGVGHNLSAAPIQRVYYESSRPIVGGGTPGREFTGIATLGDNSYYVTRVGALNTSLVDPDNAVMLFSKSDTLRPRELWPNLVPVGTGLKAMSQMSAIATFARGTDFLYAVKEPSVEYKVQWITFVQVGDFFGWESRHIPTGDPDFYLKERRFLRPEGLTVDAFNNFYVADAGRDSIYRFDRRGVEQYSFGGRGSDTRRFNEPYGVAWYDGTLYVADAGNHRIARYRLSTDIR